MYSVEKVRYSDVTLLLFLVYFNNEVANLSLTNRQVSSSLIHMTVYLEEASRCVTIFEKQYSLRATNNILYTFFHFDPHDSVL